MVYQPLLSIIKILVNKIMQKVLVVGDSCNDVFVYGRSVRLSPDAPVPVFNPVETIENGGMGLNVQANVLSFGVKCDILDQAEKIKKTRYVDKKTNHTFLRVDTGEGQILRVKSKQLEKIKNYSAIIISDYDKGFLHKEDIEYICDNHPLVFLDTKKHISSFCKNATFIKINEVEYNESKIELEKRHYRNNLIVTLGGKGCIYRQKIYPVDTVQVKDMSGAGDTFMASLVVNYLKSSNIEQAIKFANLCATNVVQKRGVAIVGKEDIIRK
tara:strand:+ start:742 stop:1551 length:810 start_codon:yes stop_codon:yes gene_type:complete